MSLSSVTQPGDTGGGDRGPVPKDWNPGDVILGLYEVREILGQGGMGAVHRIYHRAWGIDLAVKSPTERLLSKANGVERVERECETWINLGLHPHVVSCYYVRRIADIPRIFAEYVDGGNLWDWIRSGRLYEGGRPKALQRILQVAIQAAWGIHHAHVSGVIHRDLKPQNFMLTAGGNVKVTDFGLAQVFASASAESLAKDGVGMTPAFGSPEQFARTELTPQSDVWSWALCVLQMFSLKVRWKKGIEAPAVLEDFLENGKRYSAVPEMPPGLIDLLRRCFREDPTARPAGMLAVVEPLKELFEESAGMPFPGDTPHAVDAVADNLNNRAVSLIDLGKRQEAVSLWERALEADSQHAASMYNLGLVYWRAGGVSDDRILRRLKDIALQHEGEALPLYLLIQAHLERGDIDTAVAVLADAQRAFPERGEFAALARQAEELRPYARRLVKTLDAHADVVTAVQLSADGRHAVSASEDNTMKLWAVERGECVRVYTGHQGSVDSLGINADSTIVMSTARDRTLRIWDRQSGDCARDLPIDREASRGAVLSSDGRHALVRKGSTQFMLMSVLTGQPLMTFTGHTDWVHAMAFCPGESYVVSGADDGTVRVWSRETGICARTMAGHDGGILTMAVAEEMPVCITGGRDGCIFIWDWKTGENLRVMKGHRGAVRTLAVARDGLVALSGGDDGTVRMWATRRGRCVRTFDDHEGEVRTLALSADGALGISGGLDKRLRLWQLSTRLPFRASLIVCKAQRTETALSAQVDYQRGVEQARRAASTGDFAAACQCLRAARSLEGYSRHAEALKEWGSLYIRLPRRGLRGAWESGEVFAHDGGVYALDCNRDGRFLLTGGADGAVRLWSVENQKCLRNLVGHTGAVKAVSIAGDARVALTGGEDHGINLWDLASGALIRAFEGAAGSVEAVALSPDGRYALTGGWDLRLWEVHTGRHLRTLEGHTADVVSVHWGRDGSYALSGSSDETLRLWDIPSGHCVRVLAGEHGAVRACDLSPDGALGLSASSSIWGRTGQLELWDLRSGQHLRDLEGHRAIVRALCIAPDSTFAFSACHDGSWRLWDLRSGQTLRAVEGHGTSIDAIAITPDARRLVTGDHKGKMQFWTLDWDLAEVPRAHWDERATPLAEAFLDLHAPYAAELPQDMLPSQEELFAALQRKGQPAYTEEDIDAFMFELGSAGLGYLSRAGVAAQLQTMAARRGRFTLFGRKRR